MSIEIPFYTQEKLSTCALACLAADIQDTTIDELGQILANGKWPIVYLDRAIFDLTPSQRARHSIRDSIIHNVIPTEVTARFVVLHDPRLPRVVRRTRRLFRQAFESLGFCRQNADGS